MVGSWIWVQLFPAFGGKPSQIDDSELLKENARDFLGARRQALQATALPGCAQSGLNADKVGGGWSGKIRIHGPSPPECSNQRFLQFGET
jgi:hypothetical protein